MNSSFGKLCNRSEGVAGAVPEARNRKGGQHRTGVPTWGWHRMGAGGYPHTGPAGPGGGGCVPTWGQRSTGRGVFPHGPGCLGGPRWLAASWRRPTQGASPEDKHVTRPAECWPVGAPPTPRWASRSEEPGGAKDPAQSAFPGHREETKRPSLLAEPAGTPRPGKSASGHAPHT